MGCSWLGLSHAGAAAGLWHEESDTGCSPGTACSQHRRSNISLLTEPEAIAFKPLNLPSRLCGRWVKDHTSPRLLLHP